MEKDQASAPRRRTQDIMAFYRERIMYLLGIAVAVLVTPFAVINFIQGNYFLTLAIAGVISVFGIDAVAIHLNRRPPIPFAFLLLPTMASIALSLETQGVKGAMWCYPAILMCYFVLPRRAAVGSSIALLVASAIMVYISAGEDTALRFAVSMALTSVVIYIITDVIRDLQRELMDQAITDPLTGAYNRRQMEFTLDDAIERHQRTGAAASILLIDIDHFKKINDDLGHDAGDRVLKALVLLIKNRTRKLDRLFRVGGEEFLLFLPDTPASAAMKQAENLRLRIAEDVLLKQRQVTVSIGVAECSRDITQEAWIKTADNALYKAKATGRNKVVSGHDMPTIELITPTPYSTSVLSA
jgi:diguanylate cyclase (GGDEF)-like protein